MKNKMKTGFMAALMGGMLIFSACSSEEPVTVKSYSAKLLSYPAGNGKSQLFISLADGQIYGANQAAASYATWDFGYYALSTEAGGGCLSSTRAFPSLVFDVRQAAGVDQQTQLNKCFFHLSTKTAADFNAVNSPDDLDNISIEASQTNERVKNLVPGSVVELVTNDGKKGLIKVSDVNISQSADGYIKMDIKVQP